VVTTTPAAVLATPQIRLRPNVLAHPSPTTGRFLLLIATLLSVGLLAGTLVHNGLLGSRWAQAARACAEAADGAVPIRTSLEAQIAHNEIVVDCLAPYERTRALVSLGGAVVIGLLGLAVVMLVPPVLRRRLRLRPAGPRLDAAVNRIAELAAQAGLRRAPRLLVGPAAQRDAFVFGLPGRYFIVLPTALVVRWRQVELFDPVVRHELAHVRRHDVPLAWLATAVWIAAIPVLTVPLIVAVVSGDYSLMPAYLWRAAIVMGVLWLVQRQALRSREHDADLHAARQAGDWRPLGTVLETQKATPGWWQRMVSHHPTVANRLQVLVDPGRVRGVSVLDGMAAGFLTALLLPSIRNLVQVAATGSAVFSWSTHIAALLVGPITGLAVGVGLWRQAMIDHVTGRTTWPGGAVAGVVAGLLIGAALRLDDLGVDEAGTSTVSVVLLIGAAAVLLSAGTGRLWADAAARLPGGPRSWWIGFIVNALIFAVALWALQWVPVVLQAASLGGFTATDLAVSFGSLVGPVFYLTAVPLIVATAAMVWRRRHLPTPQWLVEGPAPNGSPSAREPGLLWALLAGAIPGLLAATGIHIHRLIAGRASDDDLLNRYLLWLVVAALVALAVSFATVVAVPRSGAAVGLVTGAVAVVVGALGMVAANTFLIGNIFELPFWWSTIVTAATLWLAGYLLILPLTLVVWPAPWRNVSGWLLALLTVAGGGFTAFCVIGLALAN
jgi:Zn-dependent protease with chaperone function